MRRDSGRGGSRPEGLHAHREDLGGADAGASAAAHARAVITVRLTLLLLLVGAALFLFNGPGGVLPSGPGDPAVRQK